MTNKSKDDQIWELRAQLRQARKGVELERLRAYAYDTMINLAEETFNIPIRKNLAPNTGSAPQGVFGTRAEDSLRTVWLLRDVKGGEPHKETKYYISSLEADAQYINYSIRTHWSVENQLHWTLDVAFGDDASRKQKGNAAQNFSLLNRIGLNIIRNAKVSSMGVKGHRKKAGITTTYCTPKSFNVVKN